ncbi:MULTISPECIES: beta-propeller fold lactonase family protein [unclassified Novosphingobium]|uniref:beta-propeller fold lactonase family protein n=1 Tax=unclassified Novosphingobium TaxID=2644732 RepID=UPI001357762F|nr:MULTISPECIES: beta-propeller fold lactonase family protein [unclassified Novosphingobium]
MKYTFPLGTLGAIAALVGTAGTVQAETMIYVADADSQEVGVLTLDETSGHLRPIQRIAVGGNGMAVSPDRRMLYVGLRSAPYSVVGQESNGMTSYAIDGSSGELTPVFHIAMGKNPNWIEIIDIPE